MFKLSVQRRVASTFYELFPKTFPQCKPIWLVDQSQLRKEYRLLQAQHHPDMVSNGTEPTNAENDQSSLLNQAYHTLKDPLLRSQYMLKVVKNIDLKQEDVAQKITQNDSQLLLEVLDVHEQLEEMQNEEEIRTIDKMNKKRIKEIEARLNDLYKVEDYDTIVNLTVELKYWVNLSKAIKEWEPNQFVKINH